MIIVMWKRAGIDSVSDKETGFTNYFQIWQWYLIVKGSNRLHPGRLCFPFPFKYYYVVQMDTSIYLRSKRVFQHGGNTQPIILYLNVSCNVIGQIVNKCPIACTFIFLLG